VEDEERVPISEELQEYLVERGYGELLLIDGSAKVNIIGLDGRPVEPCGHVERGTGIPESCELGDIDLQNLNEITILVTTGSPRCKVITQLGYVYKFHAGGDRNPHGGTFRAGWVKCHDAPGRRPWHRLP
jgi:hypothetical protein